MHCQEVLETLFNSEDENPCVVIGDKSGLREFYNTAQKHSLRLVRTGFGWLSADNVKKCIVLIPEYESDDEFGITLLKGEIGQAENGSIPIKTTEETTLTIPTNHIAGW
jgi:hypothetical protein